MPRRSKPKAAPVAPNAPAAPRAADVDAILDEIAQAALEPGSRADAAPAIARLQQFPAGAADALVQRIIGGRARLPFVELTILTYLAQERSPELLERIAASRKTPDNARLAARHYQSWESSSPSHDRLRFLARLHDADGALAEMAAAGCRIWPAQSALLEDVLDYLVALPSARRQVIARAALDDAGARGWPLRNALLHLDDPAVQELALDAARRAGHGWSTAAVRRLSQTSPEPAIRAAAQAMVGAIPDGAPVPTAPLPDLLRSSLSMIDGVGGQSIILVRRWSEGTYCMLSILMTDDAGIKDVWLADGLADDDLADAELGLMIEGVWSVEVDLAAVRGALQLALEVNTRAARPLPPAFELWEPFVHDTWPPAADEPVTLPSMGGPLPDDTARLLRYSRTALDRLYFRSWEFPPERTLGVMAGLQPPQGKLTNAQYEPLIEQLIDPATRRALHARLQRQAWLLDHVGNGRLRDTALAVAHALPAASPPELSKIPFLRQMVQQSVEVAERLAAFSDLDDLDDLSPFDLLFGPGDDFLDDENDVDAEEGRGGRPV